MEIYPNYTFLCNEFLKYTNEYNKCNDEYNKWINKYKKCIICHQPITYETIHKPFVENDNKKNNTFRKLFKCCNIL